MDTDELQERIQEHNYTYAGITSKWITWGPLDRNAQHHTCYGCGNKPVQQARLIAGSVITIVPTCNETACMRIAIQQCLALYGVQQQDGPEVTALVRSTLRYGYTQEEAARVWAETTTLSSPDAITALATAYNLHTPVALALYEHAYYAAGRQDP